MIFESEPIELSDGTFMTSTTQARNVKENELEDEAFKTDFDNHIIDSTLPLSDTTFNKYKAEKEKNRLKAEAAIAKRIADEAAAKVEAVKVEAARIEAEKAKEKAKETNVNAPTEKV